MKRILIFFSIIMALRLFDSFILRTDQGVIGELFTHKIAGILLLVLFLRYCKLDFALKDPFRGILSGLAIGGSAYFIAYSAEIGIAYLQGNAPALQFYTTSYNITGNIAMNSGVTFIFICIIGNIINVVMEDGVFRGLFIRLGEQKWSFMQANLFSALLFGVWHGVMPLRNYIDGTQSLAGALAWMLLIASTSVLFAIQLGLQFKMSGSLWDGMTVHFINNTSANLLHVVMINGESNMFLRISIAQTIMFAVVLVRYCTRRGGIIDGFPSPFGGGCPKGVRGDY